MKKNKILWIGSFQSKDSFEKSPIPNMGQASALTSQRGIIEGIDSSLDKDYDMDTINVIPYKPYPIYPNKYVKSEKWSRNGNSFDYAVGYHNIKYLTYLSREKELYKAVKKWGVANTCTHTIVYAPSVGKLKSALFLKKKYGSKVFVIIPDIPEHVSTEANKIIRIAKHISSFIMKSYFKKVDGFVLYSSDMADYYGFSKDKWILMEGVFDKNDFKNIPNFPIDYYNFQDKKKIKLTYCGVMNDFRATPTLLEAFIRLDSSKYELHLYGTGESVTLINDYANRYDNIFYHGFLKNREEIIEAEINSDILLHIRKTDPPEKMGYCFPSKLFEYLASGKPVVSVVIRGIPSEYFSYMFKIDHMNADDFVAAIQSVVDLPQAELYSLCLSAKKFIADYKTSDVQGRRILDFLGFRR